MRKPRLSERTIKRIYDEGRAYGEKYEYELITEWSEELNAYNDYLYCWDKDYNYKRWEVPPQGIWAFKK